MSFVLPNSALLLLSCFSPSSFLLLSFSECNKDVFTLFNLRVSSLTEPGLYQEKNILVPGIQTNTNSSTDTADHEQVWQPYAVDPYYSAIRKWGSYLRG